MIRLNVLLSPEEQLALVGRDLGRTSCVVFDVLRATTTLLELLAQGATAVRPVSEIAEAVACRRQDPRVLLAGERDGLRISAAQAEGMEFDLGNSPREPRRDRVAGRTVVMTTTNGTRALQSCSRAATVWVAAMTNLTATVQGLIAAPTPEILLVCSGTGSGVALEDVLGAGALIERWLELSGERGIPVQLSDAARATLDVFRAHRSDLLGAMQYASNARRLLQIPELAGDVTACLEVDRHAFAARLGTDGLIRRH